MDAIAHRGGAALAALVAPTLVLHVADQPDLDRAAFLAAVAAIPGEILDVRDAVVAHRTGATGVQRERAPCQRPGRR